MEGRYPGGLLFVLTHCKEPGREEEFNRWYNRVHLPDVCATGLVRDPSRYRNIAPTLNPGEGRYLALYETDQEDLRGVLKGIGEQVPRWTEQGRMDPALDVVLATMYRRIGGEFRASSSPRKVTGVLMVMTQSSDPAQEKEFNDWYNKVHIPDILSSGLYHTAYRFENATSKAGGGRFLALYETDTPDPGAAAQELVEKWRPRWQAANRYSPLLQVVGRGVFRKVWPQ